MSLDYFYNFIIFCHYRIPDLPSPSLLEIVQNPSELIENSMDDSITKLQNFSASKNTMSDEYIVIQEPKILKKKTEEILNVNSIFNDSGGKNDGGQVVEDDNKNNDNQEGVVYSSSNDKHNAKILQNSVVNSDSDINLAKAEQNIIDSTIKTEVIIDVNDTNVNLTEENQIPVYSEWAQKHIEEAVKQEQEIVSNLSTTKKNATIKQSVVKLREKNYASPDCGAKIIASNPEAQSTSSVLSTSRDEYMLNPCQSRIWFVVELCEPIRAEKVELANFELFSSSPKQFSIAVSNRYPTRDWSLVGQFSATDERTIQKFELHPHLFGKFVRVEVHSHYSSEHFCPISLFSVYGTSEFEAFATENEVLTSVEDFSDDDDEGIFDDNGTKIGTNDVASQTKKQDQNILKSASDAVMSIVKKAAEVLTKSNDNSLDCIVQCNETQQFGFTPNYKILCDYCTDNFSMKINETLKYKYYNLLELVASKHISNLLTTTKMCSNFIKFPNDTPHTYPEPYFSFLLPMHYTAAMCNILFSHKYQHHHYLALPPPDASDVTKTQPDTSSDIHKLQSTIPLDLSIPATSTDQATSSSTSNIRTTDPSEINPTKTQPQEIIETSIEPPPTTQSTHHQTDNEFRQTNLPTDSTVTLSPPTNSNTDESKEKAESVEQHSGSASTGSVGVINTPEHVNILDEDSQKLVNSIPGSIVNSPSNQPNTGEENPLDIVTDSPSGVSGGGGGSGDPSNIGNQAVPLEKQKVHTESVFIRLSNRIKVR